MTGGCQNDLIAQYVYIPSQRVAFGLRCERVRQPRRGCSIENRRVLPRLSGVRRNRLVHSGPLFVSCRASATSYCSSGYGPTVLCSSVISARNQIRSTQPDRRSRAAVAPKRASPTSPTPPGIGAGKDDVQVKGTAHLRPDPDLRACLPQSSRFRRRETRSPCTADGRRRGTDNDNAGKRPGRYGCRECSLPARSAGRRSSPAKAKGGCLTCAAGALMFVAP